MFQNRKSKTIKRIRVDLLKDKNGNVMLILQNKENISLDVEIEINTKLKKELTEQFGKGKLSFTNHGEISKAVVSLKAEEVKVYRD